MFWRKLEELKIIDLELLNYELFVKGKTYKQIASENKLNLNSLKYFGRKNGIIRQKEWEYQNSINGEEIESLYLDGMFLNEIADKFCINNSDTVKNVLINRNVKLRTKGESKSLADKKYIDTHNGRKYSLNHDYFKTWSNNMAYILGLIYADGNIHKTSFKISLKYSDYGLLEKIREELDYTGSVDSYDAILNDKSYKVAKLLIRSKVLTDDLIELGVTPNKSLTIEFPNIPLEYETDFIRGYFDGDGSVGMQYPTNSKKQRTKTCQIRVRICSGSENFLISLSNIMVQHYGLKNVKVRQCKENLFEIGYSTMDSLKIYDLFYKNSSIYLQRKKDSFDKYIKQRNYDIENNK